ncbi:MAG TPA: hypothetical protein VMI47_01140 [Pseudolabrys sp.]|nr:hypothetical protein [Pseudolabrys sp.]
MIEAKSQTAGRSAAAQEGVQWGLYDLIAAILQSAAERDAAARQHHGPANADCVGGKSRGVGAVKSDTLLRPHMLVDCFERGWAKGAGKVEYVAARKHAKRRIEMIEVRIGEGERDAARAELLLDDFAGGDVGAVPAAHPELPTLPIPDAITGTFERHARRHFHNLVNEPARLQRAEYGRQHRLFTLALGMEETRQQRLAVKHHCGVGGEDEIGKIGFRIDRFDDGAVREQGAVKTHPLPHGRRLQRRATIGP